jgi:hypothetical protein
MENFYDDLYDFKDLEIKIFKEIKIIKTSIKN